VLTIRLTEAQLNNLLVFLSRVEMKGEEAYAYVNLIHLLKSAQSEKPGEELTETL